MYHCVTKSYHSSVKEASVRTFQMILQEKQFNFQHWEGKNGGSTKEKMHMKFWNSLKTCKMTTSSCCKSFPDHECGLSKLQSLDVVCICTSASEGHLDCVRIRFKFSGYEVLKRSGVLRKQILYCICLFIFYNFIFKFIFIIVVVFLDIVFNLMPYVLQWVSRKWVMHLTNESIYILIKYDTYTLQSKPPT